MPEALADPAVEWLLQSADPSVRYLTLTEVVDRPADDPEVQAVASTIADGPRVRALLSGQHEDGGFRVHPYRKWTGGFTEHREAELASAGGAESSLGINSSVRNAPAQQSTRSFCGCASLHTGITTYCRDSGC